MVVSACGSDGEPGVFLIMRIVSISAAIVVALMSQSAFGQSMPTYWRLADPEAKMLMGIDVKALMNSQAASEWSGQLQKAAGGVVPLEMLNAMDDGGVLGELFRHVDRVFISLGDIPQNTSKASGTVALVGDFDLAALRKFMAKQGGAKSLYRGVEVWQSGKAADNVMIALASPQVLALGDKASLRKAVSQFAVGDGSLMGHSIFQRAAAMAQANDVWIAGEVPATAGKSPDMAAQMMKSVQSFDLGVRMKSGLAMEVNLYTPSAEAATGLSAALQGMAQLAANGSGNPQASDLLSRMKMGTDGDRIQMSASWTPAELSAAMHDVTSGIQGMGTSSIPGAKRTASRTPAPSTALASLVTEPAKPRAPLKVKIYNPDGGVKELELTRD